MALFQAKTLNNYCHNSCCFSALSCLFYCMEVCLRFLSKNAYIMVSSFFFFFSPALINRCLFRRQFTEKDFVARRATLSTCWRETLSAWWCWTGRPHSCCSSARHQLLVRWVREERCFAFSRDLDKETKRSEESTTGILDRKVKRLSQSRWYFTSSDVSQQGRRKYVVQKK